MSNLPADHDTLAAVNERARLLHDPPLPEGFRCDMSRVGSVRRCWERALKEHHAETGLHAGEALGRIEAELRNPVHAPVLHVERR